MDPRLFDRLARAVTPVAGRRAVVGAGLAAFLFGSGDATRGKVRPQRKKKKTRCVPRCKNRVCGPDGCGGVCGTCPGPTGCNAQGRCVGCQVAADCPRVPCQEAACLAGACTYLAAADGTGCSDTKVCCGGACTNVQRHEDHCGTCGNACASNEACFGGTCVPGCDVCPRGCDFNSVQAAIAAASAGSTIRLCPGTYEGTVSVDKAVTLVGLGADPNATVLSHHEVPIVTIPPTINATLRNLTVTGATSGAGGAVLASGPLRMEQVHVTDNQSSPLISPGAGISALDTLNLVDCLVRGNSGRDGAGIAVGFAGRVVLTRTEVSGNTAANEGGGIYNFGTVRLRDGSTVTGNTAASGAGILNSGTVIVEAGSSISGNTPDNCLNAPGGGGCP